ncbi:MAG TPA: class II fructose-bisphosphatase [Phenylobacterium sp.]|uniref:class II fructose-bisphosphatase n=1 Tax=Phenylobacterium sp. TaxID=1871053 RepID=UPI002B530465|nr:class II fructose-bisphosphatase [Phenylobacterium sp.]HSV03628.1 class II fructose-bisphosphatase [Phenylobacterium sp.]
MSEVLDRTQVLDRSLVLDAVRVTEIAAIAAWRLAGRGDEKAADQAAVDAMRTALNDLDIDGEIVIGEGERDEAPMLYIGEKVGKRTGRMKIDIALDPLEGTTLTAKAMANALAVMAWAPKGTLLNAPDTYMDKIACGPGYPKGVIDLDRSPVENVQALARAKGVEASEVTVCVLDRPRHAEIIAGLRSVGARVYLITDGDVAGVMNTADPTTGVDMYVGQGGAPEGVLACAALKCVGGQFQGRLVFRNADERARAARVGITDLDKKYDLHEMVRADAIFAATGVTKGALLDGVRLEDGFVHTHTLVMNSATRTVREVRMKRPV